ncbi:Uncharacterised protein [Mycobacterium tuberculosis]|nr:Uncharacterised protein [Mycobacterium tuberculosis]
MVNSSQISGRSPLPQITRTWWARSVGLAGWLSR